MPTISFNITTAQGQLLLDAFRERHPNYEQEGDFGPLPPGLTDIQKAKRIISDVMQDYLRLLKQRQAMAAVDDSDTGLSV